MHSNSEVEKAMIDVLVTELDLRVHPETKAFFSLVKEETTQDLANFYTRYNRAVLSAAFQVRHAIERFEEEMGVLGEKGEAEVRNNAHAFVRSLHPDAGGQASSGYAEIEPILGALRGFDDDGLSVVLGNLATRTAEEILDDDTFDALMTRLHPEIAERVRSVTS